MESINAAMLVALFVVLVFALGAAADAAPSDLPEAEQKLVDTVDPWGLAFSDQLVRYKAHFSAAPDAPFALGITHGLVKIWPSKYWFRGETAPAGGVALRARELWAAAGETVDFQVAVLPRIGAPEREYTVTVEVPGANAQVYREVFVRTSAGAAYPRFASDRWPDPLLPASTVTAGAEAGVFWVDVAIPENARGGQSECKVTLTDGTSTAAAVVPLRVVPGLKLDPKAFPFIAWCNRQKMTDDQYRGLCTLMLEHHAMPVDALKGQWDAQHPERFDELRGFLTAHGQRLFEVDGPSSKDFAALYSHLKQKGWLSSTCIYSNQDEPDDATFIKENVPFMRMMRDKYLGLKVYLASDGHENMDQGCDAWMTDLSASGYDPEKRREMKRPELWHYYCHLPIHWQMRAPLVDAPNMQIDNPALEHRLALWMSHYYGAKVVFIWAGNAYTFGSDFWQTLKLDDKPSGFPYGGVHNGNGWVVYPSPDGAGTVPSLRLKVIRDGLGDVALMEAARKLIQSGKIKGGRAKELERLLDPRPEVFVHPQHFDRLPETLLGRREAILRLLAG